MVNKKPGHRMHLQKYTVSGVGCALADFLYTGIDLYAPTYSRYMSKLPGDGGLDPGNLVFTDDLEAFSGMAVKDILKELTNDSAAEAYSIGGPSIVSLIHAAQLLDQDRFEVRFFGACGNDKTGARNRKTLRQFPLNTDAYKTIDGMSSPYTYVLSGPGSVSSESERTFINHLGAAAVYRDEMLDDSFFHSDLVCFGGTALLPEIHDDLHKLLKKVKENGGVTLVNTVFDFRNEKRFSGEYWPLGDTLESLKHIDILIMNAEEALKISGEDHIIKASEFFIEHELGAFMITRGKQEVLVFSDGLVFEATDGVKALPVLDKVKARIKAMDVHEKDTTGCGDNFAGGVIVSLAEQLRNFSGKACDIYEAASWGIASGGLAGMMVGGTYKELIAGEKRREVEAYRADYLRQIANI